MPTEHVQIFPFVLDSFTGKKLWDPYFEAHKAVLDERYGTFALTSRDGKTGNFKRFAYFEFDTQVVSPTKVKFVFYGMDDSRGGYGMRGDLICEIERECHLEALAGYIESRKQSLATKLYESRLEAERKRIYELGVQATYAELFGAVGSGAITTSS